MKCIGTNCTRMIVLFFYLIFGLSCDQDHDLLVGYVLTDNADIEHRLSDDFYIVTGDSPVILDVLQNDGLAALPSVKIMETSIPQNGTVKINADNTLTYTPNTINTDQVPTMQTPPAQTPNAPQADMNDSDVFSYTAQSLNPDNTLSQATGTVNIIFAETQPVPEQNEALVENQANIPSTTEQPAGAISTSAQLLFKSGFDGVSITTPTEGYQYLRGTDSKTGFNWPISILGSDFGGIHRVNDDNGRAIDNTIEMVMGPTGSQGPALFQRVNYDVQVTQTPYQINNIKENPKELYMGYYMKTDAFAVKGIDKWRAIWEYKTDDYASNKDGFRIIAFMATDYQGKPYWLFQGDTGPQNPVWQKVNRTVPLIMGEWFKVEYYIKWSDDASGYASMKVNGQLIGEHHGPTTSNSDDLDFIMLTQVYGNSYPMHQWVDDIEIWDGIPPH